MEDTSVDQKRSDLDQHLACDQQLLKKTRIENTADSETVVIKGEEDQLCSQDFEADIAKAMELSLAEAEKLSNLADKYDTPLSKTEQEEQQQQPERVQQCPVCDKYLALSGTTFEQHVNRCLDDEEDDTQNVVEQVSSWRQIFQTVPAFIQSTLTNASSPGVKASTPTSSPASPRTTKKVPDYKWMKDTKFVVDAFSYGDIPDCDGYFLTHFHSDHYHGLGKSWCHGPIFCSQVTANLVIKQLQVDEAYIHVLPMDEPIHVLPHVKVTLIDANHCPGSVLFIFDIQQQQEKGTWVRHLHTGDFRANPKMCLHPLLCQPDNPVIDHLYLDTTYLNAKYGFPAQEECIQAACRIIETYMGINNSSRPKTSLEKWIVKGTSSTTSSAMTTTISEVSISAELSSSTVSSSPKHRSAFDELMATSKTQKKTEGLLVVVGSYSIGKEKVFHSIAKLMKSKIFVTATKRKILQCQEDKDLEHLLTDNQKEAQVHVLPLNDIKAENMHAYLKSLAPRFNTVIAFKPTGWTFKASKAQETDMEIGSLSQVTVAPSDRNLTLTPQHSSPTVKIYGVPYSEHSSFRELASFIASLNITHVVPTVNMESERNRQKMMRYLDKWQDEKKDMPVEVVPYPALSHW